jgi:hypothetical protein
MGLFWATTHPGVAAVAESGCKALRNIAGSDAGNQAVIAAGGPSDA